MRAFSVLLVVCILSGCGESSADKNQRMEAEVIRLTKENVEMRRIVMKQARVLIEKEQQIENLQVTVETLVGACSIEEETEVPVEHEAALPSTKPTKTVTI